MNQTQKPMEPTSPPPQAPRFNIQLTQQEISRLVEALDIVVRQVGLQHSYMAEFAISTSNKCVDAMKPKQTLTVDQKIQKATQAVDEAQEALDKITDPTQDSATLGPKKVPTECPGDGCAGCDRCIDEPVEASPSKDKVTPKEESKPKKDGK